MSEIMTEEEWSCIRPWTDAELAKERAWASVKHSSRYRMAHAVATIDALQAENEELRWALDHYDDPIEFPPLGRQRV